MPLRDGDTVLFQGDSVTDAGRNREVDDDLGHGYAMIAAAWFAATHPGTRVRFRNRGISGNRVKDLRGRWDDDCIALKPTWVSILIGINDTWRRYDSNDRTSPEAYTNDYRIILDRVRQELRAKLIICEPFVLPVTEERERYREDLDPKIYACRTLAREFGAIYVPFDGLFAQAAAQAAAANRTTDVTRSSTSDHLALPIAHLQTQHIARAGAAFWAADGVHPSPAGHALMAKSWLEAVEG